MQVQTQTTLRVTVSLTETEATWLRDLVQNQMSAHEPPEHSEFRRVLFEALRQGLDDERRDRG